MLSPQDTAYPLLRSHYPAAVLDRDYTPTSSELVFVCTSSKGKASRLALLTLLKTAQRLGYFPLLGEVPAALPRFLAGFLGYEVFPAFTGADDRAGSRPRQLERLRKYLQVRPLDAAGRVWLEGVLGEAAHLREDMVDLVNIALEELVRERFELPAFSTLLELAQTARLSVNAGLHRGVLEILSDTDRTQLETLWQVDEAQSSPWNALRADPGKMSKTTVDAAIVRFHAMQSLPAPDLEGVLSSLKRDQFAEEARSLDAWQMRRLERGKAFSLAAVLVLERRVRLHDDIAGMLVRATLQLHLLERARPTRSRRCGVCPGPESWWEPSRRWWWPTAKWGRTPSVTRRFIRRSRDGINPCSRPAKPLNSPDSRRTCRF